MTRKDYELVANAIARMPTFAPTLRTTQHSVARALADAFETDNPRFNRETFLKACGIDS